MSHEDSRYLSPEHRQLLRTGARLPLTLTLLAHADYMDERAEAAESHAKRLAFLLGEALKAVMYISGPSHPLALEICDILEPYVEAAKKAGTQIG